MLPQHWIDDIVGFSGRANRAPFWCLPLIGTIIVLVVALAAYSAFGWSIVFWVIFAVPTILLAVVIVAVTVRRLHDRDKSGHWAWLYLLGPNVLEAVGLATGDGNASSSMSLVAFAISIWYIVDCGFLRGTAGTNSYGRSPI